MKKVKLNMKLMIIIFFFSLYMILILELQSMYIVRNWVVSIIPILSGRREFFSNFFLGMFSTGLLGVPTSFLDYYYEKEAFLNDMRCTFGTFKDRFENIGNENIDEINQLIYDGTIAKFEKILFDYKKIIFHRKFYSKKTKDIINESAYKSMLPLNDRIAGAFGSVAAYYEERKLIHAQVEMYETIIENSRKQLNKNSELSDDIIKCINDDIALYEKAQQQTQEKENQLCEKMQNDEEWKKFLHQIFDDLWHETNTSNDMLK